MEYPLAESLSLSCYYKAIIRKDHMKYYNPSVVKILLWPFSYNIDIQYKKDSFLKIKYWETLKWSFDSFFSDSG